MSTNIKGDIALDEFENLKEMIEENSIDTQALFCDLDDYEGEYGNDHIREEQYLFIKIANDYFEKNKLPFYTILKLDRVYVKKINESHFI
jgi:ribosome-interacting GTPase 1